MLRIINHDVDDLPKHECNLLLDLLLDLKAKTKDRVIFLSTVVLPRDTTARR